MAACSFPTRSFSYALILAWTADGEEAEGGEDGEEGQEEEGGSSSAREEAEVSHVWRVFNTLCGGR